MLRPDTMPSRLWGEEKNPWKRTRLVDTRIEAREIALHEHGLSLRATIRAWRRAARPDGSGPARRPPRRLVSRAAFRRERHPGGMRYYSQIPDQPRTGPWTLVELTEHHERGAIGMNTPCEAEDGSEIVRFGVLLQRDPSPPASPPPLPTNPVPDLRPTLAQQVGADLKVISPHLLLPWKEFSSGRWLRQRRVLAMAFVGLVPLAIIALHGASTHLKPAYWAIALYFSVLWAVFFYFSFPSAGISKKDAAFCFFGCALSCTLLLSLIYGLTPVQLFFPWIASESVLQKWVGFVGAVGLGEEMSKALVLVLMFRRQERIPPHLMMFYGLMAGLGFGIYEGVGYQFKWNWRATESPGGYYLLNVLRLTSLPFLHAVWSGLAGYFIGVARLHPERKVGLWTVAIALPAFLHGTYNTFSDGPLGLLVALFSVLALNLYLSRTPDLDRLLSNREATSSPGGTLQEDGPGPSG